MDNSFLNELKTFMATDLQKVELDGFPVFYVGALTLEQARQIEAEENPLVKVGRHFQVRAKDADGNLLIKPGLPFDAFMREADASKVSDAVLAMSQLDNGFEDAEKN